MPEFLANPRLFELYPTVACDLLEQIMWIGEEPKEKLSKIVNRAVRLNLLQVGVLKDLLGLRKI